MVSVFRKSCGDGDDGGGVDMDDFVFPDGVSHETSGRKAILCVSELLAVLRI